MFTSHFRNHAKRLLFTNKAILNLHTSFSARIHEFSTNFMIFKFSSTIVRYLRSLKGFALSLWIELSFCMQQDMIPHLVGKITRGKFTLEKKIKLNVPARKIYVVPPLGHPTCLGIHNIILHEASRLNESFLESLAAKNFVSATRFRICKHDCQPRYVNFHYDLSVRPPWSETLDYCIFLFNVWIELSFCIQQGMIQRWVGKYSLQI